jgi:hypothetical protein
LSYRRDFSRTIAHRIIAITAIPSLTLNGYFVLVRNAAARPLGMLRNVPMTASVNVVLRQGRGSTGRNEPVTSIILVAPPEAFTTS